VTALGIVAGLVPAEAHRDPEVRAVADPWRLDLVDQAETVPPGELGAEVAPLLVPWPCDRDLAAEHQAAHRGAGDAAELAAVPGGAHRMADALVEAVRTGLVGVAADIEAQARPLGVHPAAVVCPVHLWYGTGDAVAPPANGRWYAAHLPGASLHVVDGAGHYLAFTHWAEMLATLSPRGND
jgi:pimeloyl-ACP methyl ester carboxylesterase